MLKNLKKTAIATFVIASGLFYSTGCATEHPFNSVHKSSSPIAWEDPHNLAHRGALRIGITKKYHGAGTEMSYMLEFTAFRSPQWVVLDTTSGEPPLTKIIPNPDYFSSVEDHTVEGSRRIDVRLNDKAVWNTGNPITADAFVAGWDPQRLKRIPRDGCIQSITMGEDLRQFTITVNPHVWKDCSFATILAAEPLTPTSDPSVESAGSFGEKAVRSWWHTGSGPFILDSYDDGSGDRTTESTGHRKVVLKKNPLWWGSPPLVDSVVLEEMSAQQAAPAFFDHRIDVVDAIQLTDRDAYRQDSGSRLQWQPGVLGLAVNTRPHMLRDQAVRAAVFAAMNKAGVNHFADLSGDEPSFEVASSSALALLPATGQDPDEQFKKLGFIKNTDGVYSRGGEPLVLNLRFDDLLTAHLGRNSMEAIASSIQRSLAPRGIGLAWEFGTDHRSYISDPDADIGAIALGDFPTGREKAAVFESLRYGWSAQTGLCLAYCDSGQSLGIWPDVVAEHPDEAYSQFEASSSMYPLYLPQASALDADLRNFYHRTLNYVAVFPSVTQIGFAR